VGSLSVSLSAGRRRATSVAYGRAPGFLPLMLPGAASVSVELRHERHSRPRAPTGGCRERGQPQHCIELQAARLPRDLSRGDSVMRTAGMERPEGRDVGGMEEDDPVTKRGMASHGCH
jgi:hypothetical protein